MLGFQLNSTSNRKLATLILVFLVSFSLYGLYCINTVSEVKINGPYYKRIIQGKDVIADILPPPEYLIETYLTAYQMLDADDDAERAAFEKKFRGLRAEYESRHDFWVEDLPDDSLKRTLVADSYEPAVRMMDAIEQEFIPALRAGNRDQAETVLSLVIHREYSAHRSAIDKVVVMAVKRNREDEARAAVAVQSRTYGQIVLGILLFFTLSIFSTFLLQRSEAGPASPSGPGGPGGDLPRGDAAARREIPPSAKLPPDRTRA